MQFKTVSLLLFTLAASVLAAPAELDTRQSLPTTENGLSSACKAVTVIFARGTNEAGNVGEIAGPPWFSRLRSALGTSAITVQGVTYVADFAGYSAGGSAAGSAEMLRLINLASTKCPSTKIVLGGYSQGAQLVHNAATKLTAAVTAKIAAGESLYSANGSMLKFAVVVFGDPFNGKAVGTVPRTKVLSICHAQDVICTGSGGFTTHLNYNIDAQTAANFVVGKV